MKRAPGRGRPALGRALAATLVASVWVAACGGVDAGDADCANYACEPSADGSTTSSDGSRLDDAGPPFEPASPASYVNKVKTILTGLAATDADVQAVTADPAALAGLIDTWTARPEFKSRALDFFRNAFQQNQVTLAEMMDANGQGTLFGINGDYRARLERTLMDSFPLTAWDLAESGRPLSTALTTDTFMLTTAQMSILSYLDELPRSDDNKVTNRISARFPTQPVVFDPDTTATLAESIDPANAKFMIWPQAVTAGAKCAPAREELTNAGNKFQLLFRYLFGQGRCIDPSLATPAVRNPSVPPRFSEEDFVDYRPVRIEAAGAGDTAPLFFAIPALRTATTLKLHTPRIGFSGTLAFSANWPTNAGNDARVIANQMLIVGIGRSINGDGVISNFPVDVSDVDEAHASNPACTSCHVQLDPLKQFVRQSYTYYYHEQSNQTQIDRPAGFNIDGVAVGGHGIGDLMATMASHPRFAVAWTHKLYFWATSHAADESDPEFVRVAAAFEISGHNFKVLVRELFSSPLITYASPTQSTVVPGGDAPSIARRDQYCTALSNRLGLNDVCGMLTPIPNASQKAIAQSATMIAADGYFRAFELPALPTTPDLFFRASTEAICEQIASLVVDAAGEAPSRYDSADPTAAIADMVATVMALPPGDPRSGPAIQILTEHFASAQTAAGDSGTISVKDALRSTFQLACLSPSSVIVGL